MSEAETDHLRSYADHPIPFQPWNKDLLTLAEEIQKPIFVYVSSPYAPLSLEVAEKMAASPETIQEIKDNFIPTIVDIEECPEIELLSFYLAKYEENPLSFPMLLWITHEGMPIASTPIKKENLEKIGEIINTQSLIVQNLWYDSQSYIVNNSRDNNEQRNQFFTNFWDYSETEETERSTTLSSRSDLFRKAGRQLTSLYYENDGQIDGSGGLLPIRLIQFLSLYASHPLNSKTAQNEARRALLGICHNLANSPQRDPLDGLYSYSRIGKNQFFPTYVKTLESQANLAKAYFEAAASLGDEDILAYGIDLLNSIEEHLLGEKPISIITPPSDFEQSDLFLWTTAGLKKLLTAQEYQIAARIFNLKSAGNIPLENDPRRKHYRLNFLAHFKTDLNLADKLSLSEETLQSSIRNIFKKIKAVRDNKSNLFSYEYSITASTYADLCGAYLASFRLSGNRDHLDRAIEYASVLKNSFFNDQHLRYLNSKISARGIDYAKTSLAWLELYQVTLDPSWLDASANLTRQALEILSLESGQILELPLSKAIIPAKITNKQMIFGDSTLALFEKIMTQLSLLANNEEYVAKRQKIWEVKAPSLQQYPIMHCDLLQNTAFTDHPILCVISQDFENPSIVEMHQLLYRPPYINTVLITTPENKLITLPADFKNTPAGVTLIRNGKIIGKATTASALNQILQRELVNNS